MPPVTRVLITACVAVFLLQQLAGNLMLNLFALWPVPEALLYAPWQLLSYSFLHGDLTHLLFNMFGLWMFGAELERLWGPRRFAQVWFASVLAGALVQVLLHLGSDELIPVVGASAGLFGLLLSYGLVFPERRLMFLLLPVPIPARVFVAGYGALELFLGMTGLQPGVAHFAHLGGMLGAWLVLGSGSRRRRR